MHLRTHPLDAKGLENQQIEQSIITMDQDPTQENVWKLIRAFVSRIEEGADLLMPVFDPLSENPFEVEKISLRQEEDPAYGIARKVELAKGGMAICGFTSYAELEKGQETECEQVPMRRALFDALEDDSVIGMIINPWGMSLLLTKQLLSLIIYPDQAPEDTSQSQSSLFINQNRISSQDAQAVVNISNDPFGFQNNASREILESAGSQLLEACSNLSGSDGPVWITPGFGMPAQYIFHVLIPDPSLIQKNSHMLIKVIHQLLKKADEMRIQTLAIPVSNMKESGYPVKDLVPILALAIAGWLNEHPEVVMDITLVCPDPEVYKAFSEYLFE